MILRVAQWGEIYENNRTKDLKHMSWVPIPNKMDGDGYTELVAHSDGAAHLGAWLTIIQIASKCDPRGTLLRDRCAPHTSGSLSRISRLPREVFEAVLPRLLLIGWLELISLDYQHDAEISHDPAAIPQDEHAFRNGMERNGTEELKASSATPKLWPEDDPLAKPAKLADQADGWFEEEFWPAYWRKAEKEHSRKIFKKHATSETKKNTIVAAVKAHTPYYLSRDPEHRPHAGTWLNKLRYLEPPEEPTTQPQIRPQRPNRSRLSGV